MMTFIFTQFDTEHLYFILKYVCTIHQITMKKNHYIIYLSIIILNLISWQNGINNTKMKKKLYILTQVSKTGIHKFYYKGINYSNCEINNVTYFSIGRGISSTIIIKGN